jgi:hypothetical protein
MIKKRISHASVRTEKYSKGLLQNAKHFATALLKNRFCLTQANCGLCAPETTVCLMTSFRKERFATRPFDFP